MEIPFTLQIFYPDGDPENMWKANKPTWTGTIFYVSRDFWASGATKYKKDLEAPGIYILVGNSEDSDEDLQTIYIGQAENLHARIEQHRQDDDKKFYQSVVCVTESGGLTNTHFKWMESDLIQRAKEIKRCDLRNRTTPTKPRIMEADEIVSKQFLEATLPIFQIAEIQAFAIPKIFSLPPTDDKISTKNGKYTKPDINETRELRKKILAAFQQKENVTLLELSPSRYYDQTKTIWVCCLISKYHADESRKNYEFLTDTSRIDFLQNGQKGYFLFGMRGQSKAIAITVDKLKSESAGGTIRQWSHVSKEKGNFELRLMGGNTLDLTPYLFAVT